MPDLNNVLTDLAHLISLLDKTTGGIDWRWFGNPEAYLLGTTDITPIDTPTNTNPNPPAKKDAIGLAVQRAYIGQLLRELLDISPNTLGGDAAFVDPFVWVPINIPGNATLQGGIAWSKSTSDLQLGLGAGFINGGVNLSLLAKLLDFNQGSINPLFGLSLKGNLPPPDFLKSIAIEGDVSPLNLTITLDSLSVQSFPPANSAAFPWACVRLALIILKAWINKNANKDAKFSLLEKHLFALLGDPPSAPYPSFPLIGQANMVNPPDFSGWWKNFLPKGGTTQNTQNALALLWRLAALMTGNEFAKLFSAADGSLFFQLLSSGTPSANPPTDPSQATGTYNPGQMGAAGAWLGLVVNQGSNSFTLALDIQLAAGGSQSVRIPLAVLTNGSISVPSTPGLTFLKNNLTALNQSLPFQITGNGGGIQIPLYHGTLNAQPLGGDYSFSVQLAAGTPVSFAAALGGLPAISFPFTLTPQQVENLLADLLDWIVKFLPTNDASGIITAAGNFTSAELRNSPIISPIGNLLTSIAVAALPKDTDPPDGMWPVPAYPISWIKIANPTVNQALLRLSLGLGEDSQGNSHIIPSIKYGPLTVDQIPDFPVSIGNLYGSVDLGIDSASPFNGFTLGFDDLRLGDDKGGSTGLIASLIPNLKNAPGFSLELDWSASSGVKVKGGGKIPLQLTLGPLNLSQLLVDASASGLKVGINLDFKLSVISVNTYQLGLNFDFHTGVPTPSLQGLGLAFDGAGIKLSGMFLNNNGDYIGGAAVSIEDMFSLSALGGYTQLAGGQASLFIFASLTAPLGGPPFFFITGIAGGFGYNRMLPPPSLMGKHPFFKVMSGEIQISTDPASGLKALDDPQNGFAPKPDDYWIAAGVQFLSFGFIHGKVVLAVAFGQDFSIDILGVASFGISPVAYFEIDILVTVDKEKFLLVAGLSPNSYLIHPDIFNLSGDFALGAWHSGKHQGDFLISIGGYHPYFKVPDYYPEVNRISVNATVFGFVHVSIQCFFACTPQALMAGASVSLSAEFASIGAGLDVYIDVFIQWDPFFILATMGVDLWFEFLGRHEIGVDLQIHTPPFGGIAHISLFIVSFDVSFGDSDTPHPALPVADLFTRHLAAPATATGAANNANVQIFNTADKAGLVRVVFTSGTVAKPTADASTLQEGTDPANPVLVSPEFSFLVKTKLPLAMNDSENTLSVSSGQLNVTGDVHLPLCLSGDLSSTLTVNLYNTTEKAAVQVPSSPSVDGVPQELLASYGYYPLAYFDDKPLVPAQASDSSARSAVAGIDTSQPAIELFDGVYFNLNAELNPNAPSTFMQGPAEDLSEGNGTDPQQSGNYPLPLGGTQATYRPKPPLSFASSAAAQAAVKKNVDQIKPKLATASMMKVQALRRPLPVTLAPNIVSATSGFNRLVKLPATLITSVATPPSGVVAMAPPVSPVRRAELAGVGFSLLPAHTVAATAPPIRRPITSVLSPLTAVRTVQAIPLATTLTPMIPRVPMTPLVPVTPPPSPPAPQVTITSGNAVQVTLSGGSALHGTLAFAGQQTVRTIFTTAFGEPLADSYIAGNQRLAIPPRARKLLLIGEGMLSGAPTSLGSVGVEASTAVYAMDSREFAGYGCVLWARSNIAKHIAPGDTLTGAALLPAAAGWSVLFPVAPRGSSVVITIKPAISNPAPAATQLRWRSVNASLGGLNTVVSPDRVAFVMNVTTTQPWTLDVDVSSDWRIVGIVLADMSLTEAAAVLSGNAIWNLVDDRFAAPTTPLSTTVTLEIANA